MIITKTMEDKINDWCAIQVGKDSIDLNDANDREIVREHFNILTMAEVNYEYNTLQWQHTWFCAWNDGTEETECLATIAGAEIACIKEIYKS